MDEEQPIAAEISRYVDGRYYIVLIYADNYRQEQGQYFNAYRPMGLAWLKLITEHICNISRENTIIPAELVERWDVCNYAEELQRNMLSEEDYMPPE